MPIENANLPYTHPWLRHPQDQGLTYVYSFVGEGKKNALLKYYVSLALKFFSRLGFTFIYKNELDKSNSHSERQLTFNSHPEFCWTHMATQSGENARIECRIKSEFSLNFDLESILHELFHALLGERHQQQHPYARDIFHIGKKNDASNIEPFSSNHFTGMFHSESIMMYHPYFLEGFLHDKQKIINALRDWGYNATTAKARADFIGWYEKNRSLRIIPPSDLQSIQIIGHFIYPELEKKDMPLLALIDLFDGGQDLPIDPAQVFQYLKMIKPTISDNPTKLHTLNSLNIKTFSTNEQ